MIHNNRSDETSIGHLKKYTETIEYVFKNDNPASEFTLITKLF